MEDLLKREQLHEYQQYCVDYINAHPITVLFLDCGLGKTVITLTALNDLMLDELKISKALVVAPLRVTYVWPAELKKWEHLKDLTMSVAVGDAKTRINALNADADIYVINRENVPWLIKHYIESKTRWPFDCVVIDELSSFKNHRSQRVKWLWKVRPFVKRWIGLTGTPTSNGLMDLFSEVGILDGGERLGRFIGRFREAYFTPGAIDPISRIVYNYILRPGADEQIYDRIKDITVSMKALDYLKMPECFYVTHEVEMSVEERAAYEQLKKELILPMAGGDIEASNAATLSGKLLQMSNGCVYDENKKPREIHSRKLDMLEDLIEAANGQPVLVAYWYKHDRDRIIKRFKTAKDIDVDKWNAGKQEIALIHPASAGHGLNIQEGGHILIWFGLTWSLELYQQTNARLWRQGQKESVSIHHIVTKRTIDGKVLSALESKNITQEKLISAVRAEVMKA